MSQSTAKVMPGRCLHFMGLLLTQNEDVMTSNKCLKYYRYGGFDLKLLFLGMLRPGRITSNQIVSSEEYLPGDTSSQSFSLGPNGRGPI